MKNKIEEKAIQLAQKSLIDDFIKDLKNLKQKIKELENETKNNKS